MLCHVKPSWSKTANVRGTGEYPVQILTEAKDTNSTKLNAGKRLLSVFRCFLLWLQNLKMYFLNARDIQILKLPQTGKCAKSRISTHMQSFKANHILSVVRKGKNTVMRMKHLISDEAFAIGEPTYRKKGKIFLKFANTS